MKKKILIFIHRIGRIGFLRNILKKCFHGAWQRYVNQKKNDTIKAYKKYGNEALQRFHECMEKNNIKYTMAFGSILGAIREKGFIKHDMDIDTYIWFEDYDPHMTDILREYGFILQKQYSVDNDKLGKEETYNYKGVHIDVFYLYPPINTYPYCCIFIKQNGQKDKYLPKRIEIPISKKRRLTTFESFQVYIPENAEEICAFRYGPNYMNPDPSWDWKQANNSVVEWQEMIPVTTFKQNISVI